MLRLSHSGRAFHVAFATQAQEAFLEGHVLAFEHFGGVPARIRYDNLEPAVVRVLQGPGPGRGRAVHRAALPLRVRLVLLHPRQGGAPTRRAASKARSAGSAAATWCPCPTVASLAELNQLIAAADIVDDGRVITGRPVTVAAAFAAEQPRVRPLPGEPFDPARLLQARVDAPGPGLRPAELLLGPGPLRRPALAGPAVRPRVEVAGRPPVVARHERAAGKYAEILVLDHYLEVLKVKPGALPGATALAQARASGAFTSAHQAVLGRGPAPARRRRRHPGADRGPAAHRTLPAAVPDRRDDQSRQLRRARPAARAHRGPPPSPAGRVAPVIPIGALARYDRPAPALDGYDDLLAGSAR